LIIQTNAVPEEKMMHSDNSLLIIGNGFDLQCGLKSNYEYFFEWLRQCNARTTNNLWEVHFLNSPPKGQGWVDVEGSLLEVLRFNRGTHSIIHLWGETAKSFYQKILKNTGFSVARGEEVPMYISNCMVKMHNTSSLPTHRPPAPSMHWYLGELKSFECQFSEYLKTEVLNSDYYQLRASKLMDMMINDGKVNVISFNYTNPFNRDFSKYKSDKYMIASITNVHGTYDENNIIFGVDSTEELSHNAHIFTKTYRKMVQCSHNRALPWNIQKIKFYGHSLGKADYSYFQSIFDNYDLYGGDHGYDIAGNEQIALQFYFTIYDENKKTEIERDAVDSVYKLITAYGDTLDNKDRGKNLLHKLLLEGRIQIEFLPNVIESQIDEN